MRFTIACAQFRTKPQDPDANLRRAESFIRKAKAKGADVILFPEIFLTDSVRHHPGLVDTDHSHRNHFCHLAKAHDLDIIPGSIIEGKAGRRHNTAYYIDHRGKVLAEYRKMNLYRKERSQIMPGRKQAVFRTRFGIAGLAVCWDLAWPGMFRDMARKGAQLFYVPSHWWGSAYAERELSGRHPAFDALCLARAFENNAILSCANSAGNERRPSLAGQSQIVDPEEVLAHARHNRETLLVREVDTSVLAQMERENHLRRQFSGKKR